MTRKNEGVLKARLVEICMLLHPKQSEPCEVLRMGDMFICKPLLSDVQLRQGQDIINDAMNLASCDIEDFVDVILRRLKYKLWEFDIMKKEKQGLHKEIYKYKKRLGEDED